MYQPERHEPLAESAWNESEVRSVIREIASDTLRRFHPEKLWPAHPLDGVPDGLANIYMGASGVMLALDWLKRASAVDEPNDFAPLMPAVVERDNLWLKTMPMGAYGSLLFGDLGSYLVAFRFGSDSATVERILSRAGANNALPVLELMWGTPGSMLACIFMHDVTGEDRYELLYRRQAARLLDDLAESTPRLWTQDIYGQRARYVGLVHGFAGNMFALVSGWKWLTSAQQRAVTDIAGSTLSATAKRSETGVNWPANANEPEAPMLCQICHGAPGILVAFADAPFSQPEFEVLLRGAGELVWNAGPLKKGSNFCHGTGGNAYALLKLFERTGDSLWLDRARRFAMHAIEQWRAATKEFCRGRYSLWTGDPGLAVCLWNCIRGEAAFPALDGV